jgi:diguanylate cyclase (GGDEF)-like protein
MNRSVVRTVQGVLVAAGAPLGWLLILQMQGIPIGAELATHTGLYVYMFSGTMLAFGVFGLLLGRQEDRLLASNRELEHLSITDPLTGLHNPRYFHARLDEELSEHARTGLPLSLVILDLDHFKRINDRYGHLVGDDVLAHSARAIASVTRAGETAARVGGEEFAILLPGSTAGLAVEAAERARRAIAEAATPLRGAAGGVIRVAASAGVACTDDIREVNSHELYRAADEALYRAKAEGRNRTVVSGPELAGVSV